MIKTVTKKEAFLKIYKKTFPEDIDVGFDKIRDEAIIEDMKNVYESKTFEEAKSLLSHYFFPSKRVCLNRIKKIYRLMGKDL